MTDVTITLSSVLGIFAVISAGAGAYLRVRKVIKDRSEQKAVERAIILQEAKEITNKQKLALEAKLHHLESEMLAKLDQLNLKISNAEESLNKDIQHVKESYNSEIRFLGSKIEELKDELRSSLSQVVTLVSKLIDKN